MWLRWTLPRPRIDQVLYACVKVLLPLACVLLLGAAIWQLADCRIGRAVPWVDYNPFKLVDWTIRRIGNGYRGALVTQFDPGADRRGGISARSSVWILYAAATGRNLKQRLTDPAPIDKVPEKLVKA